MDHLEKLSEELVAVSRKVAPWIVRVNGRRGPNATGVLWNETKIVTSHRACHRDADIEIGLPDGTTTLGRITGRAPAVDLVTVELPSPVADFEPIPWSAKSVPGLVLGFARDRRGNLLSKMGLLASEELVHRISPAPEFLGSPLVDSRGKFLGLHLMAGHPRVVARKELEEMLQKLAETSLLEPAFLGLGLHRVESPEGYSCLVVQVDEPARQAGVLIGDHLLSLDGAEVEDPQQVSEIIRGLPAGSPVTLEISRAGKALEIEVTLGSRPETCFPRKFKKHMKRVIRHFRHHHHHGPPQGHHHQGRPHHHHGPPGPPPEETELC